MPSSFCSNCTVFDAIDVFRLVLRTLVAGWHALFKRQHLAWLFTYFHSPNFSNLPCADAPCLGNDTFAFGSSTVRTSPAIWCWDIACGVIHERI